MEGCSLRDAALPVRDWSGTMPLRRAGPADERPQAAPNAPLHFALQYIDGHHPYLAKTGQPRSLSGVSHFIRSTFRRHTS
jgi:hypothetical protein